MPMIKIQYDNEKVDKEDALTISNAIQKIVSEVTDIKDVFVYTNSAEINVKVAPIEIFVEMSAHKIEDADKLIEEIKSELSKWKQENSFNHPVNLSLIPMNWKIEIEI